MSDKNPSPGKAKKHQLPSNKNLGSIFNNDSGNIDHTMDIDNPSIDDYKRALGKILDGRPGVYALNVGFPEAVIYPTNIDNMFDKHLAEVTKMKWDDPSHAESSKRLENWFKHLRDAGTNDLSLTIEACRERGIPVIADYRMNAEDWYFHTYLLSDFGRAHPEWRIPLTEKDRQALAGYGVVPPDDFSGCLDPAIPEVFEHRLQIFLEVAEQYDIDGIELDFRRWLRMISNPTENYPIITELVRQIRAILDQVAKDKGRERMLLGVRVGPSLDDPPDTEYPGGSTEIDFSCRLLGLDVKTWIHEEIVDYVCPTLFWPRWPGLPKTNEFAELAKNKNVGIYPTLFPLPAWLTDKNPMLIGDTALIERYRSELCQLALDLYNDGADGISTFNWYFHLFLAQTPNQWQKNYGYGAAAEIIQHILSILGDPEALKREVDIRLTSDIRGDQQ